MRRSMMRQAGLICLLSAAGASPGQTGPDVIVGDLYETENYGVSGAIRAYAVGTISCNIGTENLLWIANNNQHPVIGQNMFRLQNGRFEQLGQAWLKHGFTALAGNLCGTCNGVSGSRLGVGCSDPYSASLNGGQSGLGPKYEVNPATGAFPYPYTSPSFSGNIARRMQVRSDELALPGALYFVESQYVTQDDAAAGNKNNNASYRRVEVASSTFNLQLRDTTQRTKPAIQAWRDHGGGANIADPAVSLVSIDVPSDGRFWIGARATQNQDGSWHYEYAIQNLTSDRAGGSFFVPVPAGAVVSNIGFRDVEYHSGEIWANTDWTASVVAGGVVWTSPQTHAQNPSTNALRWGTLYNFRFDCDRAPLVGTADLGLFKPGSPASMSVSIPVPGGAGGGGAPINDGCAAAIAVTAGSASFTTANATTDGPADCTGLIASDIWYRYTAGCDGSATIGLCGSGFDTALAVYAGGGCPSSAPVACNDNSCGTQSEVTFAVASSQEYLIRIGSAAGATGNGTMTITGPNCAPPGAANDACANAVTVTDGVSVQGSTATATNDGSASCGSSGGSPDVWYAYTPATTGSVTASTCGTAGYDTVLSIHSACGGSELGCVDDTSGCAGLTGRVTATLTAGVRYLIRVSGYNGAAGDFTLLVTGGGGGGPTGPLNDDCQNRAGVGNGTIHFDTTGATTDGPAHALCDGSGSADITSDIWYNYPAQVTGTLTISTCGSTFDTRLAVYDDTGCTNFESRLLACNDDFACPGGATLQSQVTINILAGRSYTIRVGGFNGAGGIGTLVLSSATAPNSEVYLMSFTGAVAVPGLGTVQNEDIVSYTPSTGAWAMVFDGSDVGLSALTINGLAVLPSGEFLLTFTAAASIPGMTGGPSGTTLDDSDIVRFIPATLGATTSGSFVFHFDGSDVGLTNNNENLDAIGLTADGRLMISTTGAASATGASGEDEDLLVFNAASLGAATAGSFAVHFDAGDVALTTNDEDVDAVAATPDGRLLLSTLGAFAVPAVSGGDEDILAFAPTSLGATTAGTYAMALDLSTLGIAGAADIDGLELGATGAGALRAKGPADPQGPATPLCAGDFNGDDAVNSSDISAYLAAWLQGVSQSDGAADFDENGAVNSADISAFLSAWISSVGSGC